ncbi:MAG: hypothetical protein WBG71_03080 [Leeuwenhoekiella sp.]
MKNNFSLGKSIIFITLITLGCADNKNKTDKSSSKHNQAGITSVGQSARKNPNEDFFLTIVPSQKDKRKQVLFTGHFELGDISRKFSIASEVAGKYDESKKEFTQLKFKKISLKPHCGDGYEITKVDSNTSEKGSLFSIYLDDNSTYTNGHYEAGSVNVKNVPENSIVRIEIHPSNKDLIVGPQICEVSFAKE